MEESENCDASILDSRSNSPILSGRKFRGVYKKNRTSERKGNTRIPRPKNTFHTLVLEDGMHVHACSRGFVWIFIVEAMEVNGKKKKEEGLLKKSRCLENTLEVSTAAVFSHPRPLTYPPPPLVFRFSTHFCEPSLRDLFNLRHGRVQLPRILMTAIINRHNTAAQRISFFFETRSWIFHPPPLSSTFPFFPLPFFSFLEKKNLINPINSSRQEWPPDFFVTWFRYILV